jgi:hypothetical protein
MRFITEFELITKFQIENYKILRARGAAEWIGLDIAKAFGYQVKGSTTLDGPVSEKHTLEIEAFPMDKWVEFKNALFSHIHDPAIGQISPVYILQLIKNLESFSKPEHHEQSNTTK